MAFQSDEGSPGHRVTGGDYERRGSDYRGFGTNSARIFGNTSVPQAKHCSFDSSGQSYVPIGRWTGHER